MGLDLLGETKAVVLCRAVAKLCLFEEWIKNTFTCTSHEGSLEQNGAAEEASG
jgi:hypothetical protein